MRYRKLLTTFVRMLCAFVCMGLCACREEILHELDEMRANQVQLVLERSSIEAEKVRSGAGWNIVVPHSQATAALAVLEQSRILWRDLSRFKDLSQNFIQSREERAHAAERQIAWTMEQTLERIPGVLEARVQLHLNQQSLDPFGPKVKDSGSVLLVVNGDRPHEAEPMKRLISGATGVEPDSIAVLVSSADPSLEIRLAATSEAAVAQTPARQTSAKLAQAAIWMRIKQAPHLLLSLTVFCALLILIKFKRYIAVCSLRRTCALKQLTPKPSPEQEDRPLNSNSSPRANGAWFQQEVF